MRMNGKMLTLVACIALASISVARADLNLSNGNSAVHISTSNSSGLNSWTVDGVSQIFQQWFWYRLGSSGGEHAINTLSAPSESAVGNVGTVTYSGGGLTVSVTFVLTGGSGGSGTADVAEIIAISGAPSVLNTLHMFQYADFDLGGTPGDDSVVFTNANSVKQTDGTGAWVSETSAVPTPSHHEAGFYPNMVNGLNDGNPTTLNDNNAAGPSDVAWAFQWDVTGSFGSFIISKDMHIQLPAPGAALLGWMGLGLVGWMKRRVA